MTLSFHHQGILIADMLNSKMRNNKNVNDNQNIVLNPKNEFNTFRKWSWNPGINNGIVLLTNPNNLVTNNTTIILNFKN